MGRAVLSVCCLERERERERDSKHTNHHLALSTLSYSVVFFQSQSLITSQQGQNTGLDDTIGMVGRLLDEV